MADLLSTIYPWTKALHIMAVIAWMAGLFYLPRLFVHHVERTSVGSDMDQTFVLMEGKLYRLIMTPSMLVTWGAGLLLVATPGVVDWSMIWPWPKLFAVLAMTGFQGWCSTQRKALAGGERLKSGRHYRLMNEVPTLLMIVIVLSVVVGKYYGV